MTTRWTLPVLAAAWSCVTACIDVSPGHYEPRTSDGGDAAAIDPNRVAACRQCAFGESSVCQPHYASCVAAEPKCAPFLDCMTDTDCWSHVDPGATVIPSCATACIESVGAGSFNELLPAIAFLVCASDARCGAACKGTSAAGSDAGAEAATGD